MRGLIILGKAGANSKAQNVWVGAQFCREMVEMAVLGKLLETERALLSDDKTAFCLGQVADIRGNTRRCWIVRVVVFQPVRVESSD